MHYPITLVDIVAIVLAAASLRTAIPDLGSQPRKLWRLGLPPLFGLAASLIVLAGTVVTPANDIAWLGSALAGIGVGWLAGLRPRIATDQVWGTVQVDVRYDSVVAAACLLAVTFVDSVSGLLPRDRLPEHAELAAASGLFAGYLAGRAWSLARRAVAQPHTELGTS
jgi:hypothetical protein